MEDKIYINQPLEIELEIFVNSAKMTTGASAEISVRRPDRTEDSWPAVVDNVKGVISYDVPAGVLDQEGKWLLQPIVALAGIPERVLPGTTVELYVDRRFA